MGIHFFTAAFPQFWQAYPLEQKEWIEPLFNTVVRLDFGSLFCYFTISLSVLKWVG